MKKEQSILGILFFTLLFGKLTFAVFPVRTANRLNIF